MSAFYTGKRHITLWICMSILLAFLATDAAEDRRLKWQTPPQGPSWNAVKEGDFRSYYDRRFQATSGGTRTYDWFSRFGYGFQTSNAKDYEPAEGLAFKDSSITLNDKTYFLRPLIHPSNPGKLTLWYHGEDKTGENIDLGIEAAKLIHTFKPFLYGKYLFVSATRVYDVEPIILHEGNIHGARLLYSDVPETLVSNQTKEFIRDNCFKDDEKYCVRNYDKPGEIFYSDDNALWHLKGVTMYAECGASGNIENKRCYYYLKHELTQKLWYFPQDLKVSDTDDLRLGTRVMLMPAVHTKDMFFNRILEEACSQES